MAETLIKIALSNATGKHEFEFTLDQVNDLVGGLIGYLREIKADPKLYEDVPIGGSPIPIDFCGIEPHPDSATDAVLVIRSGQAEFQFSGALSGFLEVLDHLKEQTEPDPNSHRGH